MELPEPVTASQELPIAESIDIPSLLTLPFDIQCRIVSNITDYAQIKEWLQLPITVDPSAFAVSKGTYAEGAAALAEAKAKALAEAEINREFISLLQHCVTKIQRGRDDDEDEDVDDLAVVLTLRGLKEIDASVVLIVHSISDLINIALMSHLKKANVFINVVDVFGDNPTPEMFDMAIALFISTYASGRVVELNPQTGMWQTSQRNRHLRDATFVFDGWLPAETDERMVYLEQGLIGISVRNRGFEDFHQTLRALNRAASLTGIEFDDPLPKRTLDLLLTLPSLRRIVLLPGYQKIAGSVRTLLNTGRITELEESDDWSPIILENDAFISSLHPRLPLITLTVPVSLGVLEKVLLGFPSLQRVALYVYEPLPPEGVGLLEGLLRQHPRLQTVEIHTREGRTKDEIRSAFDRIYTGPPGKIVFN